MRAAVMAAGAVGGYFGGRMRAFFFSLMLETIAVGRAAGVKFPPDFPAELERLVEGFPPMMKAFIALVGGGALLLAAKVKRARGQQPARVQRIGYLGLGPASAWATRVEVLRAGLRDPGWIEGKNIVIEFRWADEVEQLPGLAAELVRLPT